MAWWRQDGVRAVLISERNQENEMVNRMTRRGIGVTKLMSQVCALLVRPLSNQSLHDERVRVIVSCGGGGCRRGRGMIVR